MKNLKPFLIIAFFLVLIFALVYSKRNIEYKEEVIISDSDHDARVRLAGEILEVKIADDAIERSKGLSGVSGISTDWGMLFVFETPGVYAFWMKDMNFPIDIIWFDETGKVVYIKKDVQPESYPESFVPPKEKTSKYVLEVFSGFSNSHNLKIGDAIEFLPK